MDHVLRVPVGWSTCSSLTFLMLFLLLGLHWHNGDRVKGIVLVKVLSTRIDSIPRRIVMKKGNALGGVLDCFSVYIEFRIPGRIAG